MKKESNPTAGLRQFSGAVIHYLNDGEVSKTAVNPIVIERLHAQMIYMLWLNEHVPVCPRVIRVLDRGYVMERLEDMAGVVFDDVDHFLSRMKHLLASYVWSRPPFRNQHSIWYDEIITYCVDVLKDHGFPEEKIRDLTQLWNLQTHHTKECAIHGDPTLDNILVRLGHAPSVDPLVLTDPLPPDNRIPNDRAVDLGKLLQSALGWEHMKRGRKGPTDTRSLVAVVLKDEDYVTACRAWVWCLIHFIRILPYARGKEMIYPYVRQITHQLLKIRPDGVRPAPGFGF